MRSIFIVDDEENIRYFVGEYLAREGFKVESFSCVEEVMLRLQSGFPDMFILDLMLPGQDGIEFCQNIRSRSGMPVIFTLPHGEEEDRILAREWGADEYLTKPFSPRELVARVRSTFRRSSLPGIWESILKVGNLEVNPNDRRITVNDGEVMLTPQEYELLTLFAEQPQRTFNRQDLLDRIWGFDYVGDARAVDNLVKRLRKKLRESGATRNVKTVWGYGYRFDD